MDSSSSRPTIAKTKSEPSSDDAFRAVSDLAVRYLPYGELEQHREAMARFGAGLKAIHAIARTLV